MDGSDNQCCDYLNILIIYILLLGISNLSCFLFNYIWPYFLLFSSNNFQWLKIIHKYLLKTI